MDSRQIWLSKNKDKKLLVETIKNEEIYACKWDDLFKILDIRHKHLIDNLDFKKTIIENLLESNQSTELGIILTKTAMG